MTGDEARRDALRRFGSRARLREQVRDANIFVQVERLWHDVRYGARILARNPALTAIAVISIAFGTGANVAIFSLADALLLRPLPVQRPSDLLAVGSRVRHGTRYQTYASYPDYLDIRDRAHSFEGLAAYDYEQVGVISRPGEAPRVRYGTFVSSNFFHVLGIDPIIGRGFLPEEDDGTVTDPPVVLSHSLWRSVFDSDPNVPGRKLRVGSLEFTIVGVTPEGFGGLDPYVRDYLFLPLAMLPRVVTLPRPDALEARDVRILTLKGRLNPGVSIADARAELTTIGAALEQAFPETNTNFALIAQTEFEYKVEQRPHEASLLLTLTILAIGVLCVACANVAGLLASRGPVRAREMTLRLAIGASRAQLVRQLLTESLLIAAAGAAGGLAVGRLGIVLLNQIQYPTEMVRAARPASRTTRALVQPGRGHGERGARRSRSGAPDDARRSDDQSQVGRSGWHDAPRREREIDPRGASGGAVAGAADRGYLRRADLQPRIGHRSRLSHDPGRQGDGHARSGALQR